MRRRRRFIAVLLAALSVLAGIVFESTQESVVDSVQTPTTNLVSEPNATQTTLASDALEELPVKGRAPKTGYSRDQFSNDWGDLNNCSMRELILLRDLTNTTLDEDGCKVITGTLNDPYTGKIIQFQRGAATSQAAQIDHVVAVSDAWQKGAQQLSADMRYQFYNDPLNLLAVDGDTNNKKGDGDAATWLPPNKAYRCRYVARQISVKIKYSLWVTQAEHDVITRLLKTCPEQVLPITE